jgi:hypothetical protein
MLPTNANRGPRCSLALLMVAATSAAALLIASAPAAGVTPATATATNSSLSAVRCPSARSCVAVGQYGTSVFEYHSLGEHWDGTAWATEASPSVGGTFVNGLSCPSAAVCWAVGAYQTPQDASVAFAMRWNGTVWQQGDPADPSGTENALVSMYCLNTLYCLAAGYYVNGDGLRAPLIESYSVAPNIGVRWLVLTNPAPAASRGMRLTAITCNGTTDCNAVGDYANPKGVYVTVAEHYDGSRWELAPTANPAGSLGTYLNGLTCTSTTSCMAVGYYKDSFLYYRTVVERWDGTTWAIAPSTNAGVSDYLYSIACSGPTSCVAVGSTSSAKGLVALAERWNGTAWTVPATPSPGTSGQLNSVTCTSASSCTAVGSDTNSGGESVTLAEHWNGSAWSVQPAPNG